MRRDDDNLLGLVAGSASSRLRWGVVALSLAYGVSAVANFSLSALAGRFLGAGALGTYAVASTIARVFYAGTDFGSAPHLIREVARDRSRASDVVSLFASCRLLLVPVAVAFAIVIALSQGHGDLVPYVLFAAASGAVSVQIIFEVLLQAHERAIAAAAINASASLATLIAAGTWVVTGGGLSVLLALYALGAALSLLGAAWWTTRALDVRLRWRPSAGAFRREVAQSWRTGASFLLSSVALRTPVLMLGGFATIEDVGTFAAVDLFVTAASIVQAAVSNALMPRLAASYRNDPDEFRSTFLRGNIVLAVLGLATAGGLVIFGEPITRWVFAAKGFHRFGDIIPIVAWSTPALLLVNHNIVVFAATNQERANLRFMLVYCSIVALGQVVLVPALGLVGAAWGQLLGRLVGLSILGYMIHSLGFARREAHV